MSDTSLTGRTRRDEIAATTGQRRIRHQARDGVAVAVFTLGASAATVAVIWAVAWLL